MLLGREMADNVKEQLRWKAGKDGKIAITEIRRIEEKTVTVTETRLPGGDRHMSAAVIVR